MGNLLATYPSRAIGLRTNDEPTFEPQAGFAQKRQPRAKPCVSEETLESLRIPHEDRDYCSDKLVDFQQCRYKNMPLVYRCAHEKHAYLNCQHHDYILRMKEFERERRLRLRENRISAAAGAC